MDRSKCARHPSTDDTRAFLGPASGPVIFPFMFGSLIEQVDMVGVGQGPWGSQAATVEGRRQRHDSRLKSQCSSALRSLKLWQGRHKWSKLCLARLHPSVLAMASGFCWQHFLFQSAPTP